MSWHGQINRTLWEIQSAVKNKPENFRYRRELLRTYFLQGYEFDKAQHVPRDDRTFLFLQEKEAPAVLLLHGAQGTPAEMRELGNHLYGKGYSVYCPRFSRADAKEQMVSWESWVTEAETILDTVLLYAPEATFVGGLSLGATIALLLAERKPVKGAVLLAPALVPRKTFKERFYEIARYVTPTIFYRVAGWNGEVLRAMDYARKHVRKVELPVLALQAADDRRLSHRGLKFIRRATSSTDEDVRLLPHGTHVLTRGPAKSEVFERVTEFLDRISKT